MTHLGQFINVLEHVAQFTALIICGHVAQFGVRFTSPSSVVTNLYRLGIGNVVSACWGMLVVEAMC